LGQFLLGKPLPLHIDLGARFAAGPGIGEGFGRRELAIELGWGIELRQLFGGWYDVA
jgi:hypothetical protein